MKIVEQLLKLYEKLIIVNKGKKNGQVLFLAGGGGSGKGFAQEMFIDVKDYKTFDVDALKTRLIKIAKLKGDNPEIANLDLTNPDDVFKLHTYVSDKGLADKQIDNLLKGVSKDKGLPNILFDVTLKNSKKFDDLSAKLMEFGYQSQDMHLVWVLADYNIAVQNNLDPERGRVVPADILFQTHEGAGQTMSQILKGELPKNLQGEVYVLLSEKGATDLELNIDGSAKVGKSAFTGKETITIKDFPYIKVKDVGKSIMRDDKIQKQVYDWVKSRVPKNIRALFK